MSTGLKVALFPLTDGVLVLLDPDGDFDEGAAMLAHELRHRPQAFAGPAIIIDVAHRQLTTEQFLRLEALINQQLGVRVLQIVHYEAADILAEDNAPLAERERLAALAWEPPSPLGEEGPPRQEPVHGARPGPEQSRRLQVVPPREAGAPAPAIGPAGAGDLKTVLWRRTLRSGQQIAFDGNVVVLGDVNPGAEVIAGGDIIVMGALRGLAHAGAKGRSDAVVVALDLQPTQLRIGHRLGRPPEGEGTLPGRRPTPRLEVARLDAGQIVVEEGLRRDAAWAKSSL